MTADLAAAGLAAVAELDEAEVVKEAKPRQPCGFCTTGDHNLCPETIRNGSQAKAKTWECPCWEAGHTIGRQPPLNRTPARMPASALPRRTPVAVVTVDLPGTSPADPPRRVTRRAAAASPFPAGTVSPYQFRKELIERGLVPESFKPQTVYTWVKQAGKGGTFPVTWYADDGTEAPAGTGKPGVPVEAAVAWHKAGGAQ